MRLTFPILVRQIAFHAALIATSLSLLFGATSCSSTNPSSSSFASVTIQNHSLEEVIKTTCKVFGASGFTGGPTDSVSMVFEKEASRGTTMAREGLAGAFYGNSTTIRVKAETVTLSGGTIRLQCKAYAITGGSDPFFQDEVPLSHARSGPYRKLLNEVATQLK
jgi:hypothetical protein